MQLKDLLNHVETIETTGKLDIEISGVAYDSRKVKPGFVFVCIKGFQTDGHKYIPNALAQGAAAIVVQEDALTDDVACIRVADSRRALAIIAANFYGNPAKDLKIVGVTGTNGKTTVTTLLKHVLEFSGKKVGLIGTNGNMIGGEVLPSERTTPESLELHELFAQMRREQVEYVVMEVSSHSLELSRVYGIKFCIGVFTNLTQDHLDFHMTMENYLNAKKKLFEQSALGIINADDERGHSIIETAPCEIVTYSIDNESDFRAENLKISSRGVIFDVVTKTATTPVRLGIPGRFSVYNALAAIAACNALGITKENTVNGLLLAKGVKGRAETVYTKTDYTVIIDYAHTPDGLENIIETVREFAEGRVITLFGCGGDRDRSKRSVMGEIAGKLSDFCIITSDNPRTEDPMQIILQIEDGMKKTGCAYTVIENRREAIRFALENAQTGDCIILAGKGHETYQIIGTEKRHFDEREVVQELLAKQA